MPQPFNSGRDNNSTILINIKGKSRHTVSIKQLTSGGVTRPTCKRVHTITGGRKGPKHIRALSGSTTVTIKRNLAVKRMCYSMDGEEVHRTVRYVENICKSDWCR
jgi:hypothetical protein